MNDKPKKTVASAHQPTPAQNIGRVFSDLLSGTLGRLPTMLVVIVSVALVATVATGVAMRFTIKPPPPTLSALERLLPLRISAPADIPAFDPRALPGIWVSPKGELPMTLSINEKGLFEWIIQSKGSNYIRIFIRGSYRAEGAVLILGQRIDMGRPLPQKGEMIEYVPLAMQNINVIVDMQSRQMYWQAPAEELERQIPLFRGLFPADGRPMRWLRYR